MSKLRVGILGATGMVGQRFITLLEGHPWFEVVAVAASKNSAGRSYGTAVTERWKYRSPIPATVQHLSVYSVEDDIETIARNVDLVFSSIDMEKEATKRIEESYAAAGVPVVSNNSAHRWTTDVPMIMPEINPQHVGIIPAQQKNHGWSKGFIAVKPNCSIQSYVPVIQALKAFAPTRAIVTTMQAISGAGKTFDTWPEMIDNVIPYIAGEEEKSEQEPLKILATIKDGMFELAKEPLISVNCIRVPVSDGHLASVHIAFQAKPSRDELITALRNFENPLSSLSLPSAPEPFITYFDEDDRPQTKLDRDLGRGMGISVGRLRAEPVFGWKFVALSHNTIRGAAGGAILLAELLKAKGYLQSI